MTWQEVVEYKGYTITVEMDEYPEDPRQWSNLGFMRCWHKRNDLGDENTHDHHGYHQAMMAKKKITNRGAVVLDIHIYQHGGIALTADPLRGMGYPFNDRWDAGLVGYIYATKQAIRDWMGVKYVTKKVREQVKRILIQEIDTYTKYLNNEAYGYIVEFEDGTVESVWGFDDKEYAIAEAKAMVDTLPHQLELGI